MKKINGNTKKATGLTFAEALKALKKGKRVQRKGFKQHFMFVFQVSEKAIPITEIQNMKAFPKPVRDFYKRLENIQTEYKAEGKPVKADKPIFSPYLCLKTPNHGIDNGWMPSQADLQADDWIVMD